MKIVRAKNGVVYIASELLPCPHAFATRVGGVSALPHTSSLNLAYGRGEDNATVLRNLSLLGNAVGFAPEDVISLRQIHSTEVRTVTRANRGEGYYKDSGAGCDGYATTEPGITLGIKTADCVPILLAAVSSGRAYAVGALHAGWRGTLAGIAAEGVKHMLSLGADLSDIRVAIGPAIGQCCFEVGADVRDRVLHSLGSELCSEHVRASDSRADKWYADLGRINRHIFLSLGIPCENIDTSDLCTCHNPQLFYSHRRNGEARGTMLSVIRL